MYTCIGFLKLFSLAGQLTQTSYQTTTPQYCVELSGTDLCLWVRGLVYYSFPHSCYPLRWSRVGSMIFREDTFAVASGCGASEDEEDGLSRYNLGYQNQRSDAGEHFQVWEWVAR